MIAAVLVLVVTATALLAARPILARAGVVDYPNPRSSHLVPTPRGGGIVTASATVVGLIATAPVGRESYTLSASMLILMALGLLDDLRSRGSGLPWSVRLAVQTAVAVWMCASGLRIGGIDLGSLGSLELGVWGWPLTVFWLVGMTNAFNFIDGLDGMAAMQASVAGLAGWAVLGRSGWGDVYLLLCASALGFLPHNAPKARVFLGDSGSLPFGFALAAAAVGGATPRQPSAAAFAALALLSGPILTDTAATLLSRLVRHENIVEAHVGHLYQRLHQRGLSHATVGLAYAGVTCVCAACAAAWKLEPSLTWAAWLALPVIYAIVRRRVARGKVPPREPLPDRSTAAQSGRSE